MQFPDASGVPANMLPARDVSAFCSNEGLKVCGLSGGGRWIRTFGSGASGEADGILPVKDRPR